MCTALASHYVLLPMVQSTPDLWSRAGLWGLDDLEAPEVAAVLARAEAAPDDFVLKPQREGIQRRGICIAQFAASFCPKCA